MKFNAVLFDCDGVLVDSEHITTGVLRDMLAERGWEMTAQECLQTFLGKAILDQVPLIEQRTGRPVDEAWITQYRGRRDAQLAQQVQAVPRIGEALAAIQAALGERMACASGADRPKIELQLARTGLAPFFGSRIFSGYEQAQNKPAPDVYLAAARALQVAPTSCAVVEDSVTGVSAGVAAGATVLAYAPHGDGQALRAAGASQVFACMSELPGLLRA